MNKKFKAVLFSMITLIIVAAVGVFAVKALDNKDEGKISLNKTASKENDKYGRSADVVLDVSASKFTKSTTVDVVLVLDRSASMDGQKMRDTKAAATSLVEKLLKNNTDPENPIVKVGIVTYGTRVIDSYKEGGFAPWDDKKAYQTTSTELSSVESEVTTLINNIPDAVGSAGTNIDAGLERANTLLTGSTANQKVVILLSDGIPTKFNYQGGTYGNGNSDDKDCVEWNRRGTKCTKEMRPSEAAKEEANNLKETGVTIYTVGFNVEEDSSAAKFLQEVSTSEEVNGKITYPNFYLAENKSQLEKNFDSILVSITTVATNVVVTDTIPLGFELDEDKLKEENKDATFSVSKNDKGETVITWEIGELKVGTNPKLTYTVKADKDSYGAMYTNESATLTGKAASGNPAYPDGKIKETFPKPVVAIPAVTENNSYTAKLGETKTVTKEDGILSNDHIKNRLTDDNATVTDEIEVKETANSCGKLTVKNDGSLEYTPDSSCLGKDVEFDYVIKSIVKVNGETKKVISNTSKIKFTVTKDDSSVIDPKVEKIDTNNNGSTISITEPFNYRINYSATVKDHIGTAKITIVDTLPYEIDESKSNLNGGHYDKANKTITWVVEKNNINTYENSNSGEIKISIDFTVVYLDVPTDVDAIVNKANATIKVDEKENTKETEQETKVQKGTIVVKYQTTTGEQLQEDKETTGLIKTTKKTVAPKEITKDEITYKLVKLLDNETEKSFEEDDEASVSYQATYQEDETTVKYIYYKQTTDITNDKIEKTGTEKITSSNEKVKYQINYNAQIDHYIGHITTKIVDTLPYEIDESISNLNGGHYDKENKTITWEEGADINTYKDGAYKVEFKKEIEVTFKNLDNTQVKMTNKVDGSITTDINQSEEKHDEHDTEIDIKGTVITKYLDTDGNEIASHETTTEKVGNDYTTSQKDIPGYVFVKTEGDATTGKYIEGELVVKYIYYKQSGETTETKVTKTGTNEITKTTDPVEYKIQYQTTVKEYIGKAEVTIVDTLPYEIDETKSDLAGGDYNAATKTITWVETIAIDTNKNPESGNINITKNIKVIYQGISSTTREIENKVSATIKTTSTTDPVEDTSKTTVSVKGTVIAHYQDTEGNELAEDEKYRDLVGNSYQTKAKTIPGYKLVETKGNETGTYQDEQQEVTYIYYKSTGEITENTLKKDGIIKITSANQSVPYKISQNIKIENYIGTATVTIVDILPAEIDITESDLQEGIYNEEDKTITWIISRKVNTYEDLNSGIINFAKEITLKFKDLDPTASELTNKVKSTLKTENNTDEKEDEHTSEVDIKGKVIVRYIDEDGNQLLEEKTLTGKIGKSYETKEETIDGYVLIKVDGATNGKYQEDDIIVTYIYTPASTGDIEVLPPKTGVNQNTSALNIFILIASLATIFLKKFH